MGGSVQIWILLRDRTLQWAGTLKGGKSYILLQYFRLGSFSSYMIKDCYKIKYSFPHISPDFAFLEYYIKIGSVVEDEGVWTYDRHKSFFENIIVLYFSWGLCLSTKLLSLHLVKGGDQRSSTIISGSSMTSSTLWPLSFKATSITVTRPAMDWPGEPYDEWVEVQTIPNLLNFEEGTPIQWILTGGQ